MISSENEEIEQVSTRRDSKESSKQSAGDDGIDPPGFFIEEKGIHKNKKQADDESTLSGLQPKQKKNKKAKPEGAVEGQLPETVTLLKSVHEVEERLKAREQYKLVIHKIGLSKLISAHRLLKNQPWLRAAYGQTVTWTMPSPQRLQEDKKSHTTNAFDHIRCSCNSDGSAADWSGLDWSFNIERNLIDRQDFVLAVCSRDVVVGRYVLGKDDLSELLTQQLDLQKSNQRSVESSGQLFIVEGEILNDLGKAGHIMLLCGVVPVSEKISISSSPAVVESVSAVKLNDKSGSPQKTATFENSTSGANTDVPELHKSTTKIEDGIASVSVENNFPSTPLKASHQVENSTDLCDPPVIEDALDIDQQMADVEDAVAAEALSRSFVCLRIFGAAVMDLKAVHLFEPNSPVLSIESDTWQTQTEAKRQSGPAAKWTGLFWKVTVRRDVGLLVTVTSLDKLVGRALLTTEELLSSPAIQFSQMEPMNGSSISVSNTNLQIHQIVKTLSNGSDYTGRVKINMIVNHPDDLVDALQIFANDHLTQSFPGNNILHNKTVFHPFQVMVREAVAFEVAVPSWLRLLRPGRMNIPITLHCAAGSWAQSTNVVHSDGKLAHWLALGWCVPLLSEASAMRLTLWCGDVSVGAASLSPDELKTLLLHHTNSRLHSGNNSGEVLVQLRDVRGHVAAKLKLHCRYDVLPVANDGTVVHKNRPQSGLQRPVSATVSNNLNNNMSGLLNRRPISAVNTIPESSPIAASNTRPLSAGLFLPGDHNALHGLQQQHLSVGNNPLLAPTQFPILVTFVELSLVDLLIPSSMLGSLPMFLAHPSGPVLQLLCDRQSLNTASLPEDDHDRHQINFSSGGQQQQSSRWMHLPPKQWTVRIRHDSSFSLAASMRRGKHIQPIGKAQLQPLDQLLGLPVDCDNFAKLSVTIRSPEGDVAGRVVMKMLIRPVPSETYNIAANVQDSLFAVSVAHDNNPYSAASAENSKARMRIEEMQRQARDDVGRLKQEAQFIPTMPWNQRSVSSDVDNANNVVFGGLSVASNNKDNNKMLFDPRVIMDAAHSLHPHHNIQFRVCIDEIDLWELRKVHRLKRNDCRVAAASGKWTASTIAASQMRSKQTKHHYLQNGLDQDSLDDVGSDMAADRCYWTKLDWKFSVFEKQQRLRLTVSSRGKVLGGTVVLVEDLMELAADDKGGRRLTAELLGPDDEFAGNIQLTFHLDVLQSMQSSTFNSPTRNKNVSSAEKKNRNALNNNNNNNHLPPMFSPSANNSFVDTDDDANDGWGYTPHHVMEERRMSASSRGAQYVFGAEPSVLSRGHSILSGTGNQFNRNHTMDPVDADELDRNMRQLPNFPCILLLRDLAALDLLPLQQPKSLLQLSKQKKQKHLGRICIEVYAENFFQTTEVNNISTDFHTFLHLNWSVAVQEASVVRLVVRDGSKNEIGHCDLSPKQLWVVPPNSSGVREVMLTLERDGLCAGKLIARALFQPLPPLQINSAQTHGGLYDMQVNHRYNQQAGAGVVIDEHRFNDSITNSQIVPSTNVNHSNNHSNSNSHQRGRSHSMQSQQSLLQPGNLLENSVTSETHNNNASKTNNIVSLRQPSPDITYIVDKQPQNNQHNTNSGNNNNARPRLVSQGEESVLTYDTVSPLQSRRSSIQPPPNAAQALTVNTLPNHYLKHHSVDSPSQQQPTQTLRPSFSNNGSVNVATTKDILAQRAPPPLGTSSDSQRNSSSFFPSLFQRSSKTNNNNNNNNFNNNSSNKNSDGFNNAGSSLPSLSVGDTLSSVRVVIRAIALIDLPRAHTLAANQPVISLACGRFTAALPVNSHNDAAQGSGAGGAVSVTDGQTAAWDHLQISFSFDQGAQLRVHVTSRGTTIGICALNRQRVLSGRRSAQSGAFVIVDELLPPNANGATHKAAGKLKLVYDLPDLASPSHS